MRKKFFLSLLGLCLALILDAQNGLKKVYNEDINPIEQIDQAVLKAKTEGKGWQLVPLVLAVCRLHHERRHNKQCH